ncbi:MAG: MFS transporter [Thermoleophilia bacterium]|nr:MFS transporter [Thermoleophilia bacterium]
MHDRSVYPLGKRRTLIVLAGTLLGMLVASLNQTLAATAMPIIVEDLGGLGHYSWVFSAYVLGATVAIPLYGKLSDLYGRRPLFLAAILLFSIGSVLAGLAASMEQLVAARTVQGIGAGGLVPLGIAVIGDVIAPRERGRWQAVNGVVFAASAVGGPMLGGWIADNASWRLAFFVSLPLAALALVVVWFGFGRRPRGESRRIDYPGAVLLTLGTGAGLVAASSGGVDYPWRSPVILSLLAVSTLLLAAFLAWERRAPEPLVPLHLLRGRTIATAEAALFALGAATFGTVTFVPLFVQGVLRESATSAGAVITPLMLSWIASGAIAGQVVARTGRPRPVLLAGPPLMAAGFVLLALMGADASVADAIVGVSVLGAGVGLMMQTLMVVVQNAAPRELMGAVTASAQFSRWLGAALGVTLMGAVVASRLGNVASPTASPSELAAAIHPAFLLALGTAALAFVAMVLLPDTKLRKRFEPAEIAAAARAR